MGFKARKVYKAKGWISASEGTIREMGAEDFCISNPAFLWPLAVSLSVAIDGAFGLGDLVFDRKTDAMDFSHPGGPRRVEVTVTFEVKEI